MSDQEWSEMFQNWLLNVRRVTQVIVLLVFLFQDPTQRNREPLKHTQGRGLDSCLPIKDPKKRWKSFPPKSKLLKSSCAKPTQAVANKYLVYPGMICNHADYIPKKYHVTVDSMRFWRTRLRRLGHWNLSMLNSGMLDPKNLILALLYKSIPKHQTEDSKYRSAFLVADTCALVRCFF